MNHAHDTNPHQTNHAKAESCVVSFRVNSRDSWLVFLPVSQSCKFRFKFQDRWFHT